MRNRNALIQQIQRQRNINLANQRGRKSNVSTQRTAATTTMSLEDLRMEMNRVHTIERKLREAAVQLRKAVWVLQYNVDNFDSLNLPEALTNELFTLFVFQQTFNNQSALQKQNMINRYNARIQDLSRIIQSSKMGINNILDNRDIYNYVS